MVVSAIQVPSKAAMHCNKLLATTRGTWLLATSCRCALTMPSLPAATKYFRPHRQHFCGFTTRRVLTLLLIALIRQMWGSTKHRTTTLCITCEFIIYSMLGAPCSKKPPHVQLNTDWIHGT
jgi:hypothetical protein